MTAADRPAPDLSVVIPAYNEEDRLPGTLEAVAACLAARGGTWEIIVVDDGSIDRTAALARAKLAGLPGRVLENGRNRGKGASIRRGMLAARGGLVLFADADNSTPIEQVDKLVSALERTGADIAIGSRAAPGATLERRQPIHREAMGRVFNLVVQALVLPGIHDTQCGFKLFTRRAARAVFPLQTRPGFSFDVEVLLLAKRMGFKIVEAPVRWIDSPGSRVSPVRDAARMLRDVVALRLRWWFRPGPGAPGLPREEARR